MSAPKQPSWAKPTSSRSTTTTFGALPEGLGRGGCHGVESAVVNPMTGPACVPPSGIYPTSLACGGLRTLAGSTSTDVPAKNCGLFRPQRSGFVKTRPWSSCSAWRAFFNAVHAGQHEVVAGSRGGGHIAASLVGAHATEFLFGRELS